MRRLCRVAAIGLALCALPACEKSSRYFGVIPAKPDPKNPDALSSALAEFERNAPYPIGKECAPAEKVFTAIYGKLYYPEWPKLLVYVKKGGGIVGPVLLNNGNNEAHLHGAKNLFVILIAQAPLRLEARMTTLTPKWINPFIGLVSALTSAPEKKESEVNVGASQPIHLHQIDTPGGAAYWYGATGFTLQTDTVSRVSIRPVSEEVTRQVVTVRTDEPPRPVDATTEKKATKVETGTAQISVTEEIVTTRGVGEPSRPAPATPASKTTTTETQTPTLPERVPLLLDGKPQLEAESVQANFSNTEGSLIGVAIGAGGIFDRTILKTVKAKDRKGADISVDAETHHLSALVYGKFYLHRPRLRVRGRESWLARVPGSIFGPYRPSFAVIVGTNVSPSSAFNDFVVGGTIGHLIGRVGIVAGKEWTGARDGFFHKRQEGWFVGFDYSF
jgi:hypothetical protein